MRHLHPVTQHETPAGGGSFRRSDGTVERWTVHAQPGGRHVVRVEAADGELWYLALDAESRPERMQVRLREAGRTMDATYTFFEDEVLIWRRGDGPASEAVALPPGYRLLWPPLAGRELLLAGLVEEAATGPAVLPCYAMLRRPAGRGWLSGRVAELTVRADADGLTLAMEDLADARAELDGKGRLVRWSVGGDVAELEGADPLAST
jgi:hypothetical protein